jgi:hypothetical protein
MKLVPVDALFVQGVPFLHTISRNLGFLTVAHAANRKKPQKNTTVAPSFLKRAGGISY